MKNNSDIDRFRANWEAELDSAQLCRAIAGQENNQKLGFAFLRPEELEGLSKK